MVFRRFPSTRQRQGRGGRTDTSSWVGVRAASLLAAVVAITGAPALYANAGALRVTEEPMGEYRVSVWTDPTPVRPGTVMVSVLVVRPGFEGVADGVDVRVRVESGDGAVRGREYPATREGGMDPRYYAASLAIGEEGTWDITVLVEGEHGRGDATFQVTARERGWLTHPAILAILALLPLAAIARWAFRTPGKTPLS